MKARTESDLDPAYESNSFEKVETSSTGLKLSNGNGDTIDREEQDNGRKLANGYSCNGEGPRNVVGPTRFNHSIITDDSQWEKDLQPLHFDTREILEETPAIFKSLSSSIRGPDTFVYLSSLKPNSLSQNDDPCKTFVITPENADFVNRKNSLNQSSPVANGYGNKTNLVKSDSNEYLSYVIEKSKEVEMKKMNESKANGEGEVKEENGADQMNGSCLTKAQNAKSEAIEQNLKNHLDSNNDFERISSGKCNSGESDTCDRKPQTNNPNSSEDVTVLSFDRTITGKKEQAFAKLQDELQKAHQELKLKDEEVTRLTRIREDVERELEELTASLFQEAHKMVSKAKEKQAAAEKSLAESQMKMDVLTAEVVALKTLVLTSTPSRPNPHLHPQIGKEDNSGGGVNLFNRKHRRSPSHFNLKYGRENSPPDSPVRDKTAVNNNAVPNSLENRDISEVDPTIHKEFLNWSLNCKLDKTDPFIDRIYREDINLCLDFSNRELAEEVQKAIETRNIFIEAVTDKSKTIFPRKCALLEVTRQCHYRMKLGDQDTWYNISPMCRNRIIAVCDFFNYLRYIELGLVKSSAHDMYWEIMRLRKEMILARLGLSLPSS